MSAVSQEIDFGVPSLNEFFKTLDEETQTKITKISKKEDQQFEIELLLNPQLKNFYDSFSSKDKQKIDALPFKEKKGILLKLLQKKEEKRKEKSPSSTHTPEDIPPIELIKKYGKSELLSKYYPEEPVSKDIVYNYEEDEQEEDDDEPEIKPVSLKKISDAKTVNQQKLNKLIDLYYSINPYSYHTSINHELEVKFGTKGIKPLNRNDYDNVIKKLKSSHFVIKGDPSGEYYLRINCEFLDNSGKTRVSDIRTEVKGLYNVQDYCQHNNIQSIYNSNPSVVHFMNKKKGKINDTPVFPVDVDDFNFRVSYQTEETVKPGVRNTIISDWKEKKKQFRFLNRVSFQHDDYPFIIDISIVKNGNRSPDKFLRENRGPSILVYNISDSNVFNNPETYEIEIEINNNRIGPFTEFNTSQKITDALRKVIKIILSGLQKTNYPIAYSEQRIVLESYMKMIWRDKFDPKTRITSKYFIGPNSVTLQLINIAPLDENITAPNIRKDFVVTDKADGERHLMYVSKEGKIYLINTNMDIIFTGAKTSNEDCFNSLLDGELILHDKHGQFINLYAAFDVYYIKNVDVRNKLFISETVDMQNPSRYQLLSDFVKNVNSISILNTHVSTDKKRKTSSSSSSSKTVKETLAEVSKKEILSPIHISVKRFYPVGDETIFQGCRSILEKQKEELFEYTTDGLIFTHTLFGVGSEKIGKSGPETKITWSYSFKWKPPYYNTIDFLVTTVKGSNGDDLIKSLHEDGISTTSSTQHSQYKEIELRCGFSQTKDGFVNPCQNLIDDHFPEPTKENDYMPMRFYPTEPYDPNAGLCNILLQPDGDGSFKMFSEEGDVFDNNMIVEFRYDLDRENGWRWVPLRVRYDKTAKLRNGENEFGNSYKTCNDNWKSIQPCGRIEEEMLCTGENIPIVSVNEDKYYNTPSGKCKTSLMKNFHNLYVKKKLICAVANPGDILIDYACGKAGDLSKWINAKLSFVFGIDLSRDNLENRLDGSCARFLGEKKKYKRMPDALFVHGNSALNIKDGSAMITDKSKKISQMVFGVGMKDDKIGVGVSKQYNKAVAGFHISSCQFALHYFFENAEMLKGFMKNVAECTKLHGYFIGTCFDGKAIFNELKKIEKGDSIKIIEDDKKIWEIVKSYDYENFENNSSSIGYRIDVYQESINQLISEYLVNFDYLDRVMRNYGFELLNEEEAKEIGFSNGSGSFHDLFTSMQEEITKDRYQSKNYGNSQHMTENEKRISFLNKYFIYKKRLNVNTEMVKIDLSEYEEATLLKEVKKSIEKEKKIIEKKKEIQSETVKPIKIKKLAKKLIIVPATDAVDDPIIDKEKATEPLAELEEIEINIPKKVLKEKKPRETKAKKPKLIIEAEEVAPAKLEEIEINIPKKAPKEPKAPKAPKEEKETKKKKTKLIIEEEN